jgi:hypothetical protein
MTAFLLVTIPTPIHSINPNTPSPHSICPQHPRSGELVLTIEAEWIIRRARTPIRTPVQRRRPRVRIAVGDELAEGDAEHVAVGGGYEGGLAGGE